MLHILKDLKGLKVAAVDEECGEVEDVLFDDLGMVVRYFVVKTGSWLNHRFVLIAPQAITGAHPESGVLVSNLMRREIEASPPLEEAQPVARAYEESLAEHYAWNPYWATAIDPAFGPFGMMMPGGFYAGQGLPLQHQEVTAAVLAYDPHLQSAKQFAGYTLRALDGEVGHVKDLMVDAADWQIKYVVVATGHWYSRRPVVVDCVFIRAIHWVDRDIELSLRRVDIEQAPVYDPEQLGASFASNLTVYYRGLLERWRESLGLRPSHHAPASPVDRTEGHH
jgi:hypothetical protein